MVDPAMQDVDVLVVGAGGAGMTAALTCAHRGLRVVIVEKAEYFGGNTARSGGGVWIPGNYALKRDTRADSLDEAKRYLDSIVGDVVPKSRRDTYIDQGPAMMEFVRKHTPVRFKWVPDYSDYHPEAPGGRASGRSVEPVPINGHILGDELARLHPPYNKAPANMVVTQANYRWMSLGARTKRGPWTAAKVAARKMAAVATHRRMYGTGNALAIGLRKGLMDAGVPIVYGTALQSLITKDGVVTGAVVLSEGTEQQIAVRKGVILAAGGFEKSAELREKHLAQPTSTAWSTGAPTNEGDAILAGIATGAATDLMDDAWWGPTIPLPRNSWFCLAERNLPGSILVNGVGERFMNEAMPYVEAGQAMYAAEATGVKHIPCWLVFDQEYRSRYLFAGLPPSFPIPKKWIESGVINKAATLEELAGQIDVPVDALTATVERFNAMAARGVDEDFKRGQSAYELYYADPTNKPNPSLGALKRAPFYAVQIVPGDLGTKGGLVTDARARVLRPDGSVIPGLYAAGNTSSAVMGRTYAGPGATIGPAMVFGYLAALDLAGG
ncbi:MAG TPA: 3-oxosteroid 1-dehydrogenase [Aeromicrobium sp.]|nr:3-oxosteroid 1-dehydrogenase [Aeromicrobium sp.]